MMAAERQLRSRSAEVWISRLAKDVFTWLSPVSSLMMAVEGRLRSGSADWRRIYIYLALGSIQLDDGGRGAAEVWIS